MEKLGTKNPLGPQKSSPNDSREKCVFQSWPCAHKYTRGLLKRAELDGSAGNPMRSFFAAATATSAMPRWYAGHTTSLGGYPTHYIIIIIIYYFDQFDRVPFFDRSHYCGFMIGHITVGSWYAGHTTSLGGYPTRGNDILGKVVPNNHNGTRTFLPAAQFFFFLVFVQART